MEVGGYKVDDNICLVCSNELKIAGNKLESEIGLTDVYSVLKMVCDNPNCGNYCGRDLNNPKWYTEIRNKVN
jgi:hypothetical protein